MGEDKANISSGLVLEGGVWRWQTQWSQANPAHHAFLDYGPHGVADAEYDAIRQAAQQGGAPGMAAALTGAAAQEFAQWPGAVQDDAAETMAASPPSSAWTP